MNKYLLILLMVLFSACVGKHSSDAKKAEVREPLLPSEKITGDTLKIDTAKSLIYWIGTKMRGAGRHSGEISLKKGFLLLNNGKIVGGEFIVDMNSIKVTDIPPTDPVSIKNLTEHLKDEDFFDVDKYPAARFVILEAKPLPGDSLQLSGNITIKDVTKSIKIKGLKKGQYFTSRFLIDRFLWNIAYEGNWTDRTLVDREIELKVELKW